MKNRDLTKIQRQAQAAYRSLGRPIANYPARVCEELRATAYHEAAHVAARMFTGLEANHFLSVTIIPDSECNGIAKSDRNEAIWMFQTYPPPKKRTVGYCLLLMLLAGRGADDRPDSWDPPGATDWLAHTGGSRIIDPDDPDWETKGSDLFHALRVARIMREPRTDKIGDILHQAEKWTIEMLAIPEVWKTVERLAGMLLERGTITDREEIADACGDITYLGLTLPKWKRRLIPTIAERKTMGWSIELFKKQPI